MRGGDPVPIAKLLRNIVVRRGIGGSAQFQAVRAAFDAVIDEAHRGRMKVIALRGNQVTIDVDTAGLAAEMHAFHSRKLLKNMKQQPGAEFVEKLRFESGAKSDGR